MTNIGLLSEPFSLDQILAFIRATRECELAIAHLSAVKADAMPAVIEQELRGKEIRAVLMRMTSTTQEEMLVEEAKAVLEAVKKHCSGIMVWEAGVDFSNEEFRVDIILAQ